MTESSASFFTISVRKQAFKFSCGHFTVLSALKREPLHGHDYFLSFELDYLKNKFVDYNVFKNEVRLLCKELDEKVLIPTKSAHLKIKKNKKNIELSFKDDFFSLPSKDVLLLPIKNTTLEEISDYIFNVLSRKECFSEHEVRRLKVIIENCGQRSIREGNLYGQ